MSHLGDAELARAAAAPEELGPEAAGHLAACPACRAEARRLSAALAGLRSRARELIPPAAGGFVWPERRPAPRRRAWGLATAAAAAALALWLAPAPPPASPPAEVGPWAGPWPAWEEPAGPEEGFAGFVTAEGALEGGEGFEEFAAPLPAPEESEEWFVG